LSSGAKAGKGGSHDPLPEGRWESASWEKNCLPPEMATFSFSGRESAGINAEAEESPRRGEASDLCRKAVKGLLSGHIFPREKKKGTRRSSAVHFKRRVGRPTDKSGEHD